MVLGIGFLLLVSLIVSAALAGLFNFLSHLVPGVNFWWQMANFIFSFLVITLLFALIYKVLPNVKIAWSSVGIGAAITSLLFSIGKSAFGIYLGNSSFNSTYGAAGAPLIILVWVYYSTQILFLGAEFTKVYARKHKSQVLPTENAATLTESARG